VLQQGKCIQLFGISTPVLSNIFRNTRLFDENVTSDTGPRGIASDPLVKCINGYMILMETALVHLASWPLPILSFMTCDLRLLKHGLLIYGEYGKSFI